MDGGEQGIKIGGKEKVLNKHKLKAQWIQEEMAKEKLTCCIT